jgi:hypothetical protein
MKLTQCTAILVSAAFSILAAEHVSFALTTGPTLSEQVKAPAAVSGQSQVAGGAGEAPGSPGPEARAGHAGVCHISRHPRDGVPASVHACPLAFASFEALTSTTAAN